MNKLITVLPLLFISHNIFAANISSDKAENILRDTIDNTPACVVLNELSELPFRLDPSNRKTMKIGNLMEAFTKVGLLSKEKGRHKMMQNLGFSKRKIEVSTLTYSMTELGKEYFNNNAIQISKKRNKKPLKGAGFCYSDKIKITEITKNRAGYLEYYVKVPTKADWAKHKSIEKLGVVADISKSNLPVFTLAGQATPPEGLKVNAKITTLKNGDFELTYY